MFLTGTLSVTRTFSLLFPLREVKKKYVLIVVAVYCGLNLLHDTVMAGKYDFLYDLLICIDLLEDHYFSYHTNFEFFLHFESKFLWSLLLYC